MIRFHSPLNLALMALCLIATIVGFIIIPPDTLLPVHWGVSGEVDATLPRNWALPQLPAILAALWLIFWLIERFGNRQRAAASSALMNVALSAVTGLITLIQILVVMAGLGIALDVVRIVIIAMALMQIVLGNAMPKSQPNGVAGLRIPTTLADPANWQATHRFTGLLLIIAGLGLLVAAILLPVGASLLVVIIASWLLPMIAGTVYSVLLARRAKLNAAPH